MNIAVNNLLVYIFAAPTVNILFCNYKLFGTYKFAIRMSESECAHAPKIAIFVD